MEYRDVIFGVIFSVCTEMGMEKDGIFCFLVFWNAKIFCEISGV